MGFVRRRKLKGAGLGCDCFSYRGAECYGCYYVSKPTASRQKDDTAISLTESRVANNSEKFNQVRQTLIAVVDLYWDLSQDPRVDPSALVCRYPFKLSSSNEVLLRWIQRNPRVACL